MLVEIIGAFPVSVFVCERQRVCERDRECVRERERERERHLIFSVPFPASASAAAAALTRKGGKNRSGNISVNQVAAKGINKKSR